MTAFFLLLAPLVLQLLAIFLLSRYVNLRLFRRLGKTVYLLLMWPGVMVHELSHLAACLLTRTKVVEVKLFAPHEESPGSLVLGYVRHAAPAGPVSAAFIGSAPFFGGAAALWLALRLHAPALAAGGTFTPLAPTGDSLAHLAGDYARFIGLTAASLDWGSWTTYVFLFLVIVLSCHIAPSRPDIICALQGLAGIVVIIAILAAVDRAFGVSAVAGLVGAVSGALGAVTVLLSHGLAFTMILAVLVAATEGIAHLWKR